MNHLIRTIKDILFPEQAFRYGIRIGKSFPKCKPHKDLTEDEKMESKRKMRSEGKHFVS